MNLIEKIKRWWAPGEYDDERPPSEGEGYAASGSEYGKERTEVWNWRNEASEIQGA